MILMAGQNRGIWCHHHQTFIVVVQHSHNGKIDMRFCTPFYLIPAICTSPQSLKLHCPWSCQFIPTECLEATWSPTHHCLQSRSAVHGGVYPRAVQTPWHHPVNHHGLSPISRWADRVCQPGVGAVPPGFYQRASG